MSQPLPALRRNLDFMPSPVADRPGLVIRDPYGYSDATLIVPPVLVECLQCFDGGQTTLDLRALLVRLTGQIEVSEIEKHLYDALANAGFLEDDTYARLKETRQREFAEAPRRQPAHSGNAYPEDPQALRSVLAQHLNGRDGAAATLGIAAPHVSPDGGWDSYRAAYGAMPPFDPDRVFLVLGTSHYGAPERFGLTRKPFVTPLGEAVTETRLVDELERKAATAIKMEDYCHSVEHSIEFQVVFLQHLYGPGVRILPVLCGPYVHSIYEGGAPEDDDRVNRVVGALGEMAAREKLFWVLGVDMAHQGARYGDRFAAKAGRDGMAAVEQRDRGRIERIENGDAPGFWDLVRENHDDLKWCGSAPFYTFLKAAPQARGKLLHYQQWNIDAKSVVSFAGMAFGG